MVNYRLFIEYHQKGNNNTQVAKVRTDKGHRRLFALSLVRILRSADVHSADDFAFGVQHREQKGQTARNFTIIAGKLMYLSVD